MRGMRALRNEDNVFTMPSVEERLKLIAVQLLLYQGLLVQNKHAKFIFAQKINQSLKTCKQLLKYLMPLCTNKTKLARVHNKKFTQFLTIAPSHSFS